MPEIWASSDVALIPLKKYIPGAVPSKLYEAMASSVSVCLISEGEPATIVNSSNCGFVVKPGDIKQLSKSILCLINNNKQRSVFSSNGRKFVKKYFNRMKINNNFLNYLKSHDN